MSAIIDFLVLRVFEVGSIRADDKFRGGGQRQPEAIYPVSLLMVPISIWRWQCRHAYKLGALVDELDDRA